MSDQEPNNWTIGTEDGLSVIRDGDNNKVFSGSSAMALSHFAYALQELAAEREKREKAEADAAGADEASDEAIAFRFIRSAIAMDDEDDPRRVVAEVELIWRDLPPLLERLGRAESVVYAAKRLVGVNTLIDESGEAIVDKDWDEQESAADEFWDAVHKAHKALAEGGAK